ncbi:MAG: dCTP deaminase [Candidatus Peribacteria bacterium]|nr:MAG: dCTP deaminase [Candidatus Peribacteria bacterium]
MFLTDRDITAGVKSGDIVISDFDEARLNPASYDILLGNKFLIVKGHKTPIIDPVKQIYPEYHEKILQDDEEFILHPGGTVLGVSRDLFGSDEYLIQLGGKSSLARLGLIVHNTAGVINPGHFLNITFELANLNKVPIVLRPGMKIAQILFSKMTGKPDRNYKQVGIFADGEKNFSASPNK